MGQWKDDYIFVMFWIQNQAQRGFYHKATAYTIVWV